ncbi:MAG: putative 3-hydroxybutyryl-CoA dehydrogenase (Beta-hydroxybutyryl-CoA dehydrogenase) [Acidimicrobiales bacterium]|nr:putative 3-hydroxybutyryl-CoA dehydrogenase (Beta-hydroxybutyryl-CoA dehydrogenase) [Acidimicrobiales bacterium]
MSTEDRATQVVVIGAGVMGSAIAQVLATAGCHVVCCDRSTDQLAAAARLVVHGRYGWERAVERAKLSAADATAARLRLTFADDLAAVASADVVVEAIPEDLAAKMALFAEVGGRAADAVVLASNTSGLPVVALAAAAGRPSRLLGWHWSSPAQVMSLAEIVRTELTDDDAIATVTELAVRCGKHPVLVRENPQAWGFVANRVLRAAIREARLVEAEGVASAADIDAIMVGAFGWPVGPLSVLEGASEGWGDDRGGSVSTLLG